MTTQLKRKTSDPGPRRVEFLCDRYGNPQTCIRDPRKPDKHGATTWEALEAELKRDIEEHLEHAREWSLGLCDRTESPFDCELEGVDLSRPTLDTIARSLEEERLADQFLSDLLEEMDSDDVPIEEFQKWHWEVERQRQDFEDDAYNGETFINEMYYDSTPSSTPSSSPRSPYYGEEEYEEEVIACWGRGHNGERWGSDI